MPGGAFGNDGGAVELKPRPLPTFRPAPGQPPPPGGAAPGAIPPANGDGQVLASFNVAISRDPASGAPTPAPGQAPPGQPTPAVDKPIQLFQKFEPPAGFQSGKLSFFRKVEATPAAGRAALASADQWEKVPTLIDAVNNVAIANTNLPGDYALFDETLVPQTTYYAYVPQIQPGSLNSSVTIRNTGSASATVTLRFLKADGSAGLASNPTYTVAAGGTELVYVPSIDGLAVGDYSLQISSTQPISVVSSAAQTANNASTGYGALDQSGADLVLNFPQVYRDYFGFSSGIALQNTGTTAASVGVSYLSATGRRGRDREPDDPGRRLDGPRPGRQHGPAERLRRLGGRDQHGPAGRDRQRLGRQRRPPLDRPGRRRRRPAGLPAGALQGLLRLQQLGPDPERRLDRGQGRADLLERLQEERDHPGRRLAALLPARRGHPAEQVAGLGGRAHDQRHPHRRGRQHPERRDRAALLVQRAVRRVGRGRPAGALQRLLGARVRQLADDPERRLAATDGEIVYGDGWIQRLTGLAAGASSLVFQPSVDGLTPAWQGGAIVRSLGAKRLIAVVNIEAQAASAGSADWLSTYVGFAQ